MASDYTIENAIAQLGITPTDAEMAQLQVVANHAEATIRKYRRQPKTQDIDERHQDLAVEMTVYAFEKLGVDGVSSMQENGISRVWEQGSFPGSMIRRITPVPYTGFVESGADMSDYYTKDEVNDLLTALSTSMEEYVQAQLEKYATIDALDARNNEITELQADVGYLDQRVEALESSSSGDGSGFYNPKPISVAIDSSSRAFVGDVNEWADATGYADVASIPITIVPSQSSVSTAQTINLNGFGAIVMRRPGSSSTNITAPLSSASALSTGVGVEGFITLSNGSYIFLATSIVPRAIGGTDFASTIQISVGGTSSTTAGQALTTLGGITSSEVQTLINDIVSRFADLADGQNLPSGVDMNDYTTPGTYTCLIDGESAGVVNAPTNTDKFRCYVSGSVSGAGRAIGQLALVDDVENNIVKVLARVTQNGTEWSAWSPIGGSA